MKEKKRSKKGLIIALSMITAFLIALLIFLCVWFFAARYPRFEKVSREEFEILGLKEGISPQGVCTLPEGSGYDFAMSGYMVNKNPSRIYLIDSKKNTGKYITLTRNGQAVSSHFGGVTCTENYLLVADEKKIARIPLSDALHAENGASVPVYDEFETDINNAYCFYDGVGKLYVGEFYRNKNYKTDESHHLTKDGETNYAFIYAYSVNEAKEGGIESAKPESILSVRGLVQGVCVTEEKVYLSCSYGLANSHIYVYSNPLTQGAEKDGEKDGVPIYRLDKSNLVSTLTMPCMSEEICIKEGRMYVLFESLCNKYKYFVRTRMKYVISIDLNDIGE